jgi:hypothetical protein
MMMELTSLRAMSSYGFGEAALQIQARTSSAHLRLAQARMVSAIQNVAQRQENWDGFGSAEPDPTSCARAVAEGTEFIDAAFAADLGWQQPHVGSNEFGEISLEWWRGPKRLTVYIGSHEVRYVCSWGADINHHMDAGLLNPQDFPQKWRWFQT